MRLEKLKNCLLLCFFLLENFLYGGVIYGWDSFLKVIQDSNIDAVHYCKETKEKYCLVLHTKVFMLYTVCLLAKAVSGVFTLQLLKKISLSYVRAVPLFFLISGGILLAYTTESYQKMVYSGAILISLAGGQIVFCNFSVAELFPTRRCTVIALCAGAFCASRAVFHIFQILEENNSATYHQLLITWAVSAPIMLIPNIFLMKSLQPPTKSVYAANVARIFAKTKHSKKKKYQLLENEASSDDSDTEQTITNTVESTTTETEMEESFQGWRASSFVASIPFYLHVCWASVVFLVLLNYDRYITQWLKYEVEERLKTRVWQCTPFAMFFLSPFIGSLMDHSANKINEETDLDILKKKRSKSGAGAILLTTLMCLTLVLLKLTINPTIFGMILYTVAYVTATTVAFAYLSVRFPWEVFRNLLSVLWLVSSSFGMLQFPLESLNALHPLWPPIILVILLVSSLICVAAPFFPPIFRSFDNSLSVIAT